MIYVLPLPRWPVLEWNGKYETIKFKFTSSFKQKIYSSRTKNCIQQTLTKTSTRVHRTPWRTEDTQHEPASEGFCGHILHGVSTRPVPSPYCYVHRQQTASVGPGRKINKLSYITLFGVIPPETAKGFIQMLGSSPPLLLPCCTP